MRETAGALQRVRSVPHSPPSPGLVTEPGLQDTPDLDELALKPAGSPGPVGGSPNGTARADRIQQRPAAGSFRVAQSETGSRIRETAAPRRASSVQQPGVANANEVPHSEPGRSQFDPACAAGPQVGGTISPPGPMAITSNSSDPPIRQTTLTSRPTCHGGTSHKSAQAAMSPPLPLASENPVCDTWIGEAGGSQDG